MRKMNFEMVSLTPRDLSLLQGLYDFTVMSFSQVRRKFFDQVSISTASNRLSRLEKGGLVHSYKVPKFQSGTSQSQVAVIFQITKLGIGELQKRNFTQVLRDEPVRLHGYSIEHEILLVDVIEAFSNRLPAIKITHGKLFGHPREMAPGLNPDAIIEFPDGKTKWAVELELTLKCESRYRELVLKYRLAKDFERVIYVTSNPAIDEKLFKVIGGTPMHVGARPATGKFFFVNLNALLTDPEATISNGNNLLTKEVCA